MTIISSLSMAKREEDGDQKEQGEQGDQKELSKEEYINKYLKGYENYKKDVQTCFQYSEDTIKRLYVEFCDACYREYLQRVRTENDPGTIL